MIGGLVGAAFGCFAWAALLARRCPRLSNVLVVVGLGLLGTFVALALLVGA